MDRLHFDSTFPITNFLALSTNFLVVYTRFVCESARFHCPHVCIMCASCVRIMHPSCVRVCPHDAHMCDRDGHRHFDSTFPITNFLVSSTNFLQISWSFTHVLCVKVPDFTALMCASCVRIMHPSCALMCACVMCAIVRLLQISWSFTHVLCVKVPDFTFPASCALM